MLAAALALVLVPTRWESGDSIFRDGILRGLRGEVRVCVRVCACTSQECKVYVGDAEVSVALIHLCESLGFGTDIAETGKHWPVHQGLFLPSFLRSFGSCLYVRSCLC